MPHHDARAIGPHHVDRQVHRRGGHRVGGGHVEQAAVGEARRNLHHVAVLVAQRADELALHLPQRELARRVGERLLDAVADVGRGDELGLLLLVSDGRGSTAPAQANERGSQDGRPNRARAHGDVSRASRRAPFGRPVRCSAQHHRSQEPCPARGLATSRKTAGSARSFTERWCTLACSPARPDAVVGCSDAGRRDDAEAEGGPPRRRDAGRRTIDAEGEGGEAKAARAGVDGAPAGRGAAGPEHPLSRDERAAGTRCSSRTARRCSTRGSGSRSSRAGSSR